MYSAYACKVSDNKQSSDCKCNSQSFKHLNESDFHNSSLDKGGVLSNFKDYYNKKKRYK